MLTQRELDELVKHEARQAAFEDLRQADVRRYEQLARDAMRRSRSFGAASSIMGALSPMIDAMLMAVGGAILVLAIFG